MLHDTGTIHSWYIRDTFMMRFRYKLWQCNIFSFIFQDRSIDFQWILLMVSLSIFYIHATFLMHSWHTWCIHSKLERKRLYYYFRLDCVVSTLTKAWLPFFWLIVSCSGMETVYGTHCLGILVNCKLHYTLLQNKRWRWCPPPPPPPPQHHQ